jgi:hypothetical protein
MQLHHLTVIMKKHSSFVPISLLASLLFHLPAMAGKPDLTGKTLDDWTLGETIINADVNIDNLKGKIVVIEYWGVR